METLSQNDLLGLNRAIGEIYAARDIETFHKAVFSAIYGMIPYELCSWNDISRSPARFLRVTLSSQVHDIIVNKLLPVLNTHLQEHPLFPHWLSGEVVKTADYATRKQFKATGIYNEYYRHLDTETQICFSLPLSLENVATIALSKKSPGFSERDRLILTLLKPHLMGALRNIRELDNIRLERDLLHRGAEAERQGAILCRADGMIVAISAVARAMLHKYCAALLAEGDMLPGCLMPWFRAEALSHANTRGAGSFPRRVERAPLTVTQKESCLTITLLRDCTSGDYLLSMNETNPAMELQHLHAYGLTNREAELLPLLAKGKTNVEIATILGMSKRTADKHLEHIFAKLGVETRGAAVSVIRKS